MLSFRDLYTACQSQKLVFFSGGDGDTPSPAQCETTYEVRMVEDARNLTIQKSYRVSCMTRVRVPGSGTQHLNPNSGDGFKNYPLMLSIAAAIKNLDAGEFKLLDYSPKTVNTGIQLSSGENSGSSSSFSQQRSVGSSTSSTNSYGVEMSVGAMMGEPMGSVGGNFSHSNTREASSSLATGFETNKSSASSSGAAMSIKDWGGYASSDPASLAMTWIFGQEYPWNGIRDRYTRDTTGDKVRIELPDFVAKRLFDTSDTNAAQPIPYPPSELSLFGIDFTTKVEWLIPLSSCVEISGLLIEHGLGYTRGSHYRSNGIYTVAEMDSTPSLLSLDSPPLDLILLGLDPITLSDPEGTAVIGFFRKQFLVPPSPGAVARIVSNANNLYVTANGFSEPMRATVSGTTRASLKIQFKIVDPYQPLNLNLKHWKNSGSGCRLDFKFNDDDDTVVTVYVDAREGEGGTDNTLQIQLRNNQYDSIDYHDYLRLGMNEIVMTISPIGDSADPAAYEIRALSITD